MFAFPAIRRYGDEDADLEKGGFVHRLRSWTAERRRQRLRRDAFNTLLNVDKNILEDVTGLRHEQVKSLAKAPLSVDAIELAARIGRQERTIPPLGLRAKRGAPPRA